MFYAGLVLRNPGRYRPIRLIVTEVNHAISLRVWYLFERFRKLVSEFEPEVPDVPKLFQGVLRNCLDELQGDTELQNRVNRWEKQRSKSLSFVTFRSKFPTLNRGKGSFGGSRNNLQEENTWSDEDEEAVEQVTTAMRTRKGRSLSMPEITPLQQAAQSWTRWREKQRKEGFEKLEGNVAFEVSWQWRRKKRSGGKEQEKGRKSDSRRHPERFKFMLSDCKTNIEPKNTGLVFFFLLLSNESLNILNICM